MTQQFRELFRAQIWFPAPTWQLKTVCNSRFRSYDTLFWVLLTVDIHTGNIYTH